MKVIALSLASALVSVTLATEVPSLGGLTAGSFLERENAQGAMMDWVLAHHEGSKDSLLKKFHKSENPEIRARLVPLLERAYFQPEGYVGVVMMPYTEAKPKPLGIPQVEFVGVQITRVVVGTPAEMSGLKLNDIILKINKWEVIGGNDLSSKVAAEIQRQPPLTPVSLEVKRGEEVIEIELKLGILPVPSDRARQLLASPGIASGYIPQEITAQVKEFESWLKSEIDQETKNLIADRRL